MRMDAPITAQTFQATFTAKVKSAVPAEIPDYRDRLSQFGISRNLNLTYSFCDLYVELLKQVSKR
jgi:hypothetical protein